MAPILPQTFTLSSLKSKKKKCHTHPSVANFFAFARIKQRSPGWARTNDLVINSHALFRLSYQRFDLSRRSDLNGRPPYYKYGALPLSYSGFYEYRLFRHELLNVCYQLARHSRALPPRSYSSGLGVLCLRCLNPEKRQNSSLAQYVQLVAGVRFELTTSRLWAWLAT